MARRRSPRVVWLPPDRFNRLGVAGGATTGLQNGISRFFVDTPPGADGTSATAVVPVVQDNQVDISLLTQGTLSDYAQSSYRLRRIVGKIFVANNSQITGIGQPNLQIVTAGFIVLQVQQRAGVIVPTNATLPEYSTQMLQNWSDPWIWRRTWVLGNNLKLNGTTLSLRATDNVSGQGSVMEGPHVDAKTARIVGPDQRLFLVVTNTIQGGSAGGGLSTCEVITDLRVLASMRSSQGNRRNASR